MYGKEITAWVNQDDLKILAMVLKISLFLFLILKEWVSQLAREGRTKLVLK